MLDNTRLAQLHEDIDMLAARVREVPGTRPTLGMAPDGVSVVHSDTKNP